MNASEIIMAAATTLQDLDGTRWPASELVGYLNDGQRAVLVKRPDQNASRVAFTPVAGAVQALPDSAMSMIDVVANASGRKRAITKVDGKILEAVQRDWQSMTPAAEFVHFIYDLTEPRTFWLYPPASATPGAVTLLLCLYPANVPTPSGAAFTSVSGAIALQDRWKDALLHHILYRAYSKDAEYGGNAQLAVSHFELFNAALAGQLQSAAMAAPKS